MMRVPANKPMQLTALRSAADADKAWALAPFPTRFHLPALPRERTANHDIPVIPREMGVSARSDWRNRKLDRSLDISDTVRFRGERERILPDPGHGWVRNRHGRVRFEGAGYG